MDVNERDPRYVRAEQAIHRAFMTLLEDKSLDDITVSEIIEYAQVNRSTFYMHYQDKYELIGKVEARFLGELAQILEESPTLGLLLGETSSRPALEVYFRRLTSFLYNNRIPFSRLAHCRDSAFMLRFKTTIEEVLIKSGAVSSLPVPMKYAAIAFAWMTTGLVGEWAHGGFKENSDAFILTLTDIATYLQRGFLRRTPGTQRKKCRDSPATNGLPDDDPRTLLHS